MDIAKMKLETPELLRTIASEAPEHINMYAVGGCVRDALLNLPVNDWDVEVLGETPDSLFAFLKRFGKVEDVGKSFGVFKLWVEGEEYDFSVARKERKTGDAHQDFAVEHDLDMTLEEAAERRDFTINALYWDLKEEVLLDPSKRGLEDLKNRVLTPVSVRFLEDPLRVLRGMQFMGRFESTASDQLVEYARELKDSISTLPVERVFGELKKWAAKSKTPSKGLQFLKTSGWIEHFPEIEALVGTKQSPKYHPEGDVFEHTCHCCDAVANHPSWMKRSSDERAMLMMAMLCHDFGKPRFTQYHDDGGITSHGHEAGGVEPTENFLRRINAPIVYLDTIVPLVAKHLAHIHITKNPSTKFLRRLSKQLEPATPEQLSIIMRGDLDGRPPLTPGRSPEIEQLSEMICAANKGKSSVEPILYGRDLIEYGVKPGKEMGVLLKKAEEAYLDGVVSTKEEALVYIGLRT